MCCIGDASVVRCRLRSNDLLDVVGRRIGFHPKICVSAYPVFYSSTVLIVGPQEYTHGMEFAAAEAKGDCLEIVVAMT